MRRNAGTDDSFLEDVADVVDELARRPAGQAAPRPRVSRPSGVPAAPPLREIPGWLKPAAAGAAALVIVLALVLPDLLRGGAGPADPVTSAPTAVPTRVQATGIPATATPIPLGTIPSLGATVTSLKFFEGGREIPPYDQRAYEERFASATSRYIYVELNLRHPAPGETLPFLIKALYYEPDGEVLARWTLQTDLEADWTWSWHAKGWGWDDPGHWEVGAYRVELWVDDALVVEGSFSME